MNKYSFNDFLEIIRMLRSDKGCPWDKVQTHSSIRQSMIEEAYEAAEAIDNNDMENLKEELGDVLMQVVFHSQIESEQNGFTIEDVIDGISKKMIYRHPHIFSKEKVNTQEEVLTNWENIKIREKGYSTKSEIIKSVPKSLPALIRAQKVLSKASDIGMDFSSKEEALVKLNEEIRKFEESLYVENGDIEEEFGNILFSLVNISRFFKINSEYVLTKALEKFINRFERVENMAISQGLSLSKMTGDNLNEL